MRHSHRMCVWLVTAGVVLSTINSDAVDLQGSRAPRQGDTVKVSVTAYCIEGETKSGTETRPGVVAADPKVLPLGTVIGSAD